MVNFDQVAILGINQTHMKHRILGPNVDSNIKHCISKVHKNLNLSPNEKVNIEITLQEAVGPERVKDYIYNTNTS